MTNLQKAQSKINATAKKHEQLKKENASDKDLRIARENFNAAVNIWCKLDEQKKPINFLQDPQTRQIVSMELKKKFEYKGFNFAIILEPGATHKYFTLINFETGGKMGLVPNNKKTIKNFHENSIKALDVLINRIGFNEFSKVLNSYPKIN